MEECFNCGEEFDLSELTCVNTAESGNECECDACELICEDCWDV